MSELDLDQLRAELDEPAEPEKKGGRSPRQERIIAGFEEIQRFVAQHGHAPRHGEDKDIFERLYAVRLDRLDRGIAILDLDAPMVDAGTGTGELRAVSIDAEVVDPDDVEMLQDLVVAAVSEALRAAQELQTNTMGSVTGGLDLGSLGGLLG